MANISLAECRVCRLGLEKDSAILEKDNAILTFKIILIQVDIHKNNRSKIE